MPKRTNARPTNGPDPIDTLLIECATEILADHFFDPDNEDDYKALLSEGRSAGLASILLEDFSIETDAGSCDVLIEALRTWTQFRVIVRHAKIAATIEGTWSFERETLRPAKVTARSGAKDMIGTVVSGLMDAIEGPELNEEEFADFMASLEDDEEIVSIGDDPKEPPAATPLDRNRLRAIARRLSRDLETDLSVEDRGYLEQTPQTLPLIIDSLVEILESDQRADPIAGAWLVLLALQLEFVRYRLDRGWPWAIRMLDDYQHRLIALGEGGTIAEADWLLMARALTDARVPVSDAMQTALVSAGFKGEMKGPPEDMLRTLRGFLDELAGMIGSPFEVVESLAGASAIMPATLRGFMATELVLSPHAVLRDAVPMMLLDPDSAVRRDAAAALEQSAAPDSMSADALRRAITVRNWIPPNDRPGLDAAIRKARLAGVEIGAWPDSGDLDFHASMIDGSGAQSILAVSRSGKRGLFGGLLLRYGTGVIEAWADRELPRAKINKLLKEAQFSGVTARVDRAYVDTMVQHGIGTAVRQDTVPPGGLLEIAELVGGAGWKDRELDIEAETIQLLSRLDAADRTPDGIAAGLQRGAAWMGSDSLIASWFDDGPKVQEILAKVPRSKRAALLDLALREILIDTRSQWAERFLLMGLWSEAVQDAKYRGRVADFALVAHALIGDTPLEAIPAMKLIASQTINAALLGPW